MTDLLDFADSFVFGLLVVCLRKVRGGYLPGVFPCSIALRAIVEMYIGLFVIMLILMFALAFTSINLNTAQARKILGDIKAEVQASDGGIVPTTNTVEVTGPATLADNGYEFKYQITRENLKGSNKGVNDETFIYNSIYKINLVYTYTVPLFGKQVYPLSAYAY